MSLQTKLRTFPLALALGATLLSGCVATTKSLTGRTQLDIVSEAQVSATVDQYYGFQRTQAKNLQKLVTNPLLPNRQHPRLRGLLLLQRHPRLAKPPPRQIAMWPVRCSRATPPSRNSATGDT